MIEANFSIQSQQDAARDSVHQRFAADEIVDAEFEEVSSSAAQNSSTVTDGGQQPLSGTPQDSQVSQQPDSTGNQAMSEVIQQGQAADATQVNAVQSEAAQQNAFMADQQAAQSTVAQQGAGSQTVDQGVVQQQHVQQDQPVQQTAPQQTQQAQQAQQVQQTQQGVQTTQGQQTQQNTAVAQRPANGLTALSTTIGIGGTTEIDFDTDIDLGNLERLPKMAKNEAIRVAFILVNEKGLPRFKTSQVFYLGDEVKASFVAPSNPELLAECIKILGEPKIRFGTVVARYNTDKQGNVLSAEVALEAMVFGTDKWPMFKQLAREWPLAQHDVTLMCTEAEFQKWQPQVASRCFLNEAPAAMKNDLVARCQNMFDNRLDRRLGGDPKSEGEIRELLNKYQLAKGRGGHQHSGATVFGGGNGAGAGFQGFGGPAQTPAQGGSQPAQGGEDWSSLLAQGSQA